MHILSHQYLLKKKRNKAESKSFRNQLNCFTVLLEDILENDPYLYEEKNGCVWSFKWYLFDTISKIRVGTYNVNKNRIINYRINL